MNRITRRELLRRGAVGGAALSFPSLLAACGGDNGIEGQGAPTTAAPEPTDTTLAERLTISNWSLYIDIDEKTKKRPTIEQFQRETGVSVRYIEDVSSNEDWFGKFQPQLAQGDAIGRDLTVLTDWMAGRMVRLGYVEPVNKDAIPNSANLVSTLASPGWDPNREYSLPWQSGLTGIGFDAKQTGGPITSIEQLLTDPSLKGKITCLEEMPDTMGLTMLDMGADPSKVEPAAWDDAIARLQEAVDSGQIRRFVDDYGPLLASGDIAACIAWSGDIAQLRLDNPNLRFVLPDKGGMIWTDNMLIPTGGDVFTASTFMNFVYDPAIAAQIEAYVNFICPVEGAKEEMEKIDPDIASNELIFPTEDMLANVHAFDTEAADNQEYKEKYQAVRGG